uniref:Uncharacterized protein n=1 Tax=Anopheles maculatus TaxID=74869 RepID=A0A182STS3_9DIPT
MLGPATHQHSLKTVENMKTAQSNVLNNNNNNNNNHYDTSNNNYCNIIKYSNHAQQQQVSQPQSQQQQLGSTHHHHHHGHHHHSHQGHHHQHTASNSLESSSKHASAALNAINNNNNHNGHSAVVDHKPIPPPIETIPGKKLPEKRQRPTLPKLYFKSSIGMHQKSPTPGTTAISPLSNGGANGGGVVHHPPIAITPKEIAVEPQSPLFHIRYKSLSSLQLAATTPSQQDSHPVTPISPSPKGAGQDKNHLLSKSASAAAGPGVREGTLDSSRSGGRTSGDSGKLPEKKSRRLSRPRSLSNLVWDLRPHKSSSEKTKKKLYLHQFDRQQGTLYL